MEKFWLKKCVFKLKKENERLVFISWRILVYTKIIGSDFCSAYNFVKFHPSKLITSHIVDIDEQVIMTWLFPKRKKNCGQKRRKSQLLYFYEEISLNGWNLSKLYALQKSQPIINTVLWAWVLKFEKLYSKFLVIRNS